jgi:tetratricopeptide (TPR) repeat protein
MEYVNLAQDKINLYLAGKDENYFELNENGMLNDRIKQAAKKTNAANADFLKKAITLLKKNGEEDAIYLKQLEAKQNFFLARSFCKKEGKIRTFDEAFDYAKKALQAQPNAAYVYNVMYNLFYKSNKKDSALFYIKKAISLAPNWTYALCNIGIGFSDLHQYDSAKWYYKKAISIGPKLDCGYLGLGNVFCDLHQYDSAKWYFKKSISIDPKNVEEYINLGNVFFYLHQYDSAKWYFKKSISIDPKNAIEYNNLGSVFRNLNQYDSAKWCFSKAILLNPNYPDCYVNLGDLFLTVLHQFDSAATYLKQALILNPKEINAAYNFCCLYSLKKETKQALYYFEQALQNGYKDLAHIKEDTDLDYIRNAEKFKALIKKHFPNQ